mgnify:FL=1
MIKQSKPKFNLSLMFDKMFRKTVFIRPNQDGSFTAIDVTDNQDPYIQDEGGISIIDPNKIYKIRGIKRVDRFTTKLFGSSSMIDLHNNRTITIPVPIQKYKIPIQTIDNPNVVIDLPSFKVLCPNCQKEIDTDEKQLNIQVPSTKVDIPEIDISLPDITASVPLEESFSERDLGSLLNLAEAAGKEQAEGKPGADKKQSQILLLCVGAVLIGLFIAWKISTGGT